MGIRADAPAQTDIDTPGRDIWGRSSSPRAGHQFSPTASFPHPAFLVGSRRGKTSTSRRLPQAVLTGNSDYDSRLDTIGVPSSCQAAQTRKTNTFDLF